MLRRPPPRLAPLALAVLVSTGCAASIPEGSQGVASMELKGVQKMDEEAIEVCLATYSRESFGFSVGGAAAPQCGVPPFDAGRLPVELWTWPWTEWPLFNETAFERDVERVERWYRARGYYEARVTDVSMQPEEETREVNLSMTITEGEPVLIVRLDVQGIDHLLPEVQQDVRDALRLQPGDPFDEALYDLSKQGVADALFEHSFARATVEGHVLVDPETKLVRVEILAEPGPRCIFGDVIVQGQEDHPAEVIKAASEIEGGQPFSISALRDARRAIYALGPFASVELERHLRPDTPVVDILIKVIPGRQVRWGVGIGMESGGIYAQDADDVTGDSFAQWDVHLLGKVEHKNFLGGMRRLRIEERPRLIFDDPFPATGRAVPGNRITAELRQPAFLEARTTLVGRLRWDRGPDPYGGRFLRHDLVASVGPERFFLRGLLKLATSINLDIFLPDNDYPFPSTELPYFTHQARLDLRDDPRNTRRGAYFGVDVQHAGYLMRSDWDYVRITGDARGYVPVFGRIVLAGRVRLGLMEVTSSSVTVPSRPEGCAPSPDADQACLRYIFRQNLASLGPLRHRLRGGGQNSVRGYEPNRLGDVQVVDGRLLSGGLRRWEASGEIRVPVTESFGATLFVDVGDVSRAKVYRFDHPQTSLGIGLRYRTLVGPLRFDAAFAPESLQVIGQDDRIRDGVPRSTVFGLGQGAVHLTIGEAF
ncbi:MAG: BamA/TamA family outer membrane protein [Myxococcales bacterium]|jgi:outer membrane protein assembly factor BamA